MISFLVISLCRMCSSKCFIIEPCMPQRTNSFHPSDSTLLSVPRVSTCFGSRSFAVAAPTICNTLPLDIRNSPSICCFRPHLETFFYNLAFRPSWSPPYPLHLRFSGVFPLTLCAIQIYLLTYLLTYLPAAHSMRAAVQKRLTTIS